jgi:hypothetical protein
MAHPPLLVETPVQRLPILPFCNDLKSWVTYFHQVSSTILPLTSELGFFERIILDFFFFFYLSKFLGNGEKKKLINQRVNTPAFNFSLFSPFPFQFIISQFGLFLPFLRRLEINSLFI